VSFADPTNVQWGDGVGITAGGKPIGDAVYVTSVLATDTNE
jgi:hypothetical protein